MDGVDLWAERALIHYFLFGIERHFLPSFTSKSLFLGAKMQGMMELSNTQSGKAPTQRGHGTDCPTQIVKIVIHTQTVGQQEGE
jgi:hypothetical protein